MKRKKILWLCSWYPNRLEPFNGDFIQRHARAASHGHDIYVIHVSGHENSFLSATETEIQGNNALTEHTVLYKRGSSSIATMISHYRWMYLCRQAIQKYIAAHGKPDLVHVHVPVKAGIMALWMKRKYGVPYVLTEHWGIYNSIADDNFALRSSLFKKYTKRIIEGASAFISVSKYLAEGVNSMVIKKRYEIIPNVVDTNLFFYAPASSDTFRFIHVSNMLVSLKNVGGILNAFKLFLQKENKAELVMIGAGDKKYSDYAASIGIASAVSFPGEITYAAVAKEMQQSNCLLLFSNIENSPCVIGEAQCCGLPVIATHVGGIPELVSEENGMLVPPKEEASLAIAMEQMMKKYEQYNQKKIAEQAQGKFSYLVAGNMFDTIYAAASTEKTKLLDSVPG